MKNRDHIDLCILFDGVFAWCGRTAALSKRTDTICSDYIPHHIYFPALMIWLSIFCVPQVLIFNDRRIKRIFIYHYVKIIYSKR